jgi:hypothetical protein
MKTIYNDNSKLESVSYKTSWDSVNNFYLPYIYNPFGIAKIRFYVNQTDFTITTGLTVYRASLRIVNGTNGDYKTIDQKKMFDSNSLAYNLGGEGYLLFHAGKININGSGYKASSLEEIEVFGEYLSIVLIPSGSPDVNWTLETILTRA